MITDLVGRLDRVPLRDLWKTEASDFTPWLAQDENIKLLGEALGLELTVETVEATVGSFSADIVCANVTDRSKVLIENQLERTDHTHLGQILTYAAGLDAVTIVWIAARFTEEHRAAIDWLNRVTEEGFNFFGLEVELWRIGDSPVAPKFNVVARPNDWTRAVREAGERSTAQRNWIEYWTSFSDFLASKGGAIKPPKPSASYWMGWGLGRKDFTLVALVAFRDRHADVRVEIMGQDSKAHFHFLLAQKQGIEAALGFSLDWQERPDAATSIVSCTREANLESRGAWPELHEWFLDKLTAIDRVFRPRIQKLNATKPGATEVSRNA